MTKYYTYAHRIYTRMTTFKVDTICGPNTCPTCPLPIDKEEVAGRLGEQKVTLQDGRAAIVNVKYIGEKYVIFDGNDQFVKEKPNFKI